MAIKFSKDPNAVLDYTVDWTRFLASVSDTIDSVEWIPSSGVTIVSQVNTPTVATAFVSGGTLGASESVICRITTVGGRVDDRTITLKMSEK